MQKGLETTPGARVVRRERGNMEYRDYGKCVSGDYQRAPPRSKPGRTTEFGSWTAYYTRARNETKKHRSFHRMGEPNVNSYIRCSDSTRTP